MDAALPCQQNGPSTTRTERSCLIAVDVLRKLAPKLFAEGGLHHGNAEAAAHKHKRRHIGLALSIRSGGHRRAQVGV